MCTAEPCSAAAQTGVGAVALRPRIRVACWCDVSAACGAPRACSTTACQTQRATSRTHVPASRAIRVLLRVGLRWLHCRWLCPASAAMHPCARATGLQLGVAVPAMGVATKRRHGEDCLVGLVARPRIQH